MNGYKKNPWQAPPVFHHETLYKKVEKKNEHIHEHELVMEFKTNSNFAKFGSYYLKVDF